MNKKVTWPKIVGLIFCIFLGVTFFLLIGDDNRIHDYTIYNSDGKNKVVLSASQPIEQKFIATTNQINDLHLVSLRQQLDDEFTVHYQITNGNEVLAEGDRLIDKESDLKKVALLLKTPLCNVKNKELVLHLSTSSEGNLYFHTNKQRCLSFNALTLEKTTYSKLCTIVGIFLIFTIILVYVLVFFTNFSKSALFAISILVFGLLFNLLIPVANVPDEANAHITKAYHYSNIMLRIDDDINDIKIRKSDEPLFQYAYIDDQKMNMYLTDMKKTNVDNTMVSSHQSILNTKGYSFTYYLSGLGITIGRLLGLNGILCVLLGRIMNLLLFSVVAVYCFKKLPVFKELLVVFSLLPMTLQQVCSLSYDSVVITLAILVTTLTVVLFYNKKVSKREAALLIGSCALLSLCKQFAYAPLILAPLSFFIEPVFKDKKIKKLLYVLVPLLLVICAGGFIYLKLHAQPQSIFYLLVHPKMGYKVLRCTLYNYLMFYISSALGMDLGLLEIPVFQPLLIVYIFLIFYVVDKTNVKEFSLKNWQRVLFCAAFFISFLGILLGLYTWSFSMELIDLVNNFIIKGFQGRYLLPALPLLLIGLYKNNSTFDQDLLNKVLLVADLLISLSLFSIMIVVG